MTNMIALLYLFSVVMFTFIRHKTPSQKAHMICKIVNIPNTAIALCCISHKCQDTKSTAGSSEECSNFDSEWETPSLQNLWSQCKDLHCTVSNLFQKLYDQPTKHNNEKIYTSLCTFSQITSWMQWLFYSTTFFTIWQISAQAGLGLH